MRKKKLSQLLEPGMRLYFFCLVSFAVVSAFFNPYLGAAEGLVLVLLLIHFRTSNAQRKKDILKYIDNVSSHMGDAAKDTMVNAPLPMVIFRPDNEEVIWSNDRFIQLTGAREHLFDQKISDAVPEFSARWLMEGKTECPTEVTIGERQFMVFGNLVRSDDKSGRSYLATTYWVDVSLFAQVRDEFYAARPVCAILALDNYDEVMKGVNDNAKSAMLAEINARIDKWVEHTDGILCRYDRDHYLFIFEERYLEGYVNDKFTLLDAVHQVQNPSGLPVTLSIGVGKGADNLQTLRQFAALSLEMALSRGGDQAVVKNKFTFEFYGGRTKELEKRTKVKSRVMANAMAELTADASRLLIMGHKFSDMDCIGAAAGVCAIARKKGVDAFIVKEDRPNAASEITALLARLPEYQHIFISPQVALEIADSRTLLVVVDTNRPEQTISENLLEACNKVAVIDHHRRAATYIADAALNFHEPYASSASELVTELAQYILEPADLFRVEAEALLAGMVLDTKQFTMRTGSRTFEAAAFLRRAGADTGDVRKLFQNDLQEVVARYAIIQCAQIYKAGIAVARVEQPVDRITAAQAADELLNVAGIDASIVLFPDEEGRVILSGRSNGDTNVQVILEKLGGGGNAATAGAQITGKSVADATRDLLRAIDAYLDT